MKIKVTTLVVDQERALRFYTEVLGSLTRSPSNN